MTGTGNRTLNYSYNAGAGTMTMNWPGGSSSATYATDVLGRPTTIT